MEIHHYHPETGEFCGTDQASIDPLESEKRGKEIYLLPANATTSPPPTEKEGYARCFLRGEWTQVEDHRGRDLYLKSDGSHAGTVSILFDVFPDEYTLLTPCEFPKWNGEGWVTDEIAKTSAENQKVKASLSEIDSKSIRSLRELASQMDANLADLEAATTIAGVKAVLKKMFAVSQYTKELEIQAQAERAKIK